MNIRFILLSLIISNVAALATDLDQFGSKLFSTLSQQNNDQNIFLSPTSISLALSMCAVGARHETLQQMLNVLEVPSIEKLTNITEQILQVLPPAVRSTKDSTTQQPINLELSPEISIQSNIHSLNNDRTPVEVRLANRLYIQKQFHIEQQYLDLVQKSFQSDIKLEDFENEPAKAVETINNWVEEQTNQRVQNILSESDLSKDTRLVLINSLYFKGQWLNQFKKTNTNKTADFHGINGVNSKVELMSQKKTFKYAENKDLRVQIIHLPYLSSNADKQFVFSIILPNEDVQLNEVEQKLNTNLLLKQQLLSNENATPTYVSLHLPKFKLETKYSLQDVLTQMGMEDAFSDFKADFEGIVGQLTSKNRIRISKVIHKTFLDVNEDGTEAAAATAIDVVSIKSAPSRKPTPIEFKANRPFLFFIREVEHDLILFSGKLIAP